RNLWETTITALNVDTGRHFDIEQYVQEQCTRLNLDPKQFQVRTVAGTDATETILAQAEEHDLVVLGTTEKPHLVQFVSGSIPEEIARRCQKPTVIVKANTGVQSWIKRWI
ncbi:MAG: universal stress protein, partial [Bacteroidales bacterium]|nr:universal stress protein [Bacteroidales bacterium]